MSYLIYKTYHSKLLELRSGVDEVDVTHEDSAAAVPLQAERIQ